MKKIAFLLFLFSSCLFAQKKKTQDTSTLLFQANRIEFKKTRSISNFHIISGDVAGLLVVEEMKLGIQSDSDVHQWKLSLVDTALAVSWSQRLVVSSESSLLGYDYFEGKFYLLFNKNNYCPEKLIIYEVIASSGTYQHHDLTTVIPVNMSHFEVIGETILIVGTAYYRPVVITYNIHERIPKVLPGFYTNKNTIIDVLVNKKAQLFTVVLSEKLRNRRTTVRTKTFTARGDLVQDNIVKKTDTRNLLDASSTSFSYGLQYIAGTYSRNSHQYSNGFYLSKFIHGQQQFHKYYSFSDLTNFFNYLRPKHEQRIKNRITRKRKKGKVKRFNYRLLIHEILEYNGEYLLIGEAYYPRYTNHSTNNGINPYGSSSRISPYFLGYKYTHAVVLSFDSNGTLLWDHTFELEDIQTYSLEDHVVVSSFGEGIMLMYLESNEIRSKVVKKNEVVEEKRFNPIQLLHKFDKIQANSSEVFGLKKWYKDTFFAFGEQQIKNLNETTEKRDRKVFYINKIQYNLRD